MKVLYVWDAQPQVDVNTSYVPDGLNRYASVNGNNFTYDANGGAATHSAGKSSMLAPSV